MITPYLTFNGNCKEALAFYRSVFPCGEPSVLPYGDYMPEGSPTPPELLRSWVMHAEMTVCGTNVWFADSAQAPGNSGLITLSAIVPTGREALAIYDALCAGGTVTLPPTVTFYSVFHAVVRDRFGVPWQIVAEEAPVQDDAVTA
ncbi:MAG: VOC family protein [Clostridia bacterium]|nr:VOC family protein [Clostridia bacterium]